MNKLILIIAFVFSGMLMHAQIIVDDTNINELDVQYVEMVVAMKVQSTATAVIIDYGQTDFVWEILVKNNPEQNIVASDGTVPNMENAMSVLNLMTKNGWEYVSTISMSQTNSHTIKYLLKKSK